MHEDIKIPTIGEKFPIIRAHSTYGTVVFPNDFSGKWFILFSHPGDFTPVCTTEFVAFQQLLPEFKKMNTELIGLSIDQVQAHMKWVEWIKHNLGVEITFPIIADSLGEIAARLGMLRPGLQTKTIRAVYIVDDKGIIRTILNYPAELGRNLQEIYRIVYGLQIISEKKIALPANWPNNSIIGNKALIPPPNTINEIKERIDKEKSGEYDCKDWWFCYTDTK